MKHDHTNLLKEVQSKLPSDSLLCDLSDLFKVFGDTTRIRILFALFESEMCVCAIAQLLKMEQSAISHQLKVLKKNNLPSLDVEKILDEPELSKEIEVLLQEKIAKEAEKEA